MARQRRAITIDKLVEAVFMSVETSSEAARDLSGTQLPNGSDLAGHSRYEEMLDLLHKHDHYNQPFNIMDVSWRFVQARGLYLPLVRGYGAHLEGADLWGAQLGEAYFKGAHLEGAELGGADLEGAHLEGAHLGGADLEGAHLGGADLWGADLKGAHLEGAELRGAHLEGADLEGADLRAVRDLNDAHDPEYAHYSGTRLSEENRWLLDKVQKLHQQKTYFIFE